MNAQNNTLGLNSNVVASILAIADTLRGQYEKIGVTNHQMPRNPYPMHKLAINALPTSKSKALTLSQIEAAIKENGHHVARVTVRRNGVTSSTPLHLSVTLSRLTKSGAVKRSGTSTRGLSAFRYWFSL